MFLVLSVYVCVHGDPHVTITNDAWDIPYKDTKNLLALVVTHSGQDWRLVQTCSLEDSPKLVQTSGGYCSIMVDEWAVRILLECFLVVELMFV